MIIVFINNSFNLTELKWFIYIGKRLSARNKPRTPMHCHDKNA
jgi:hypothetical protein